MAPKVTLLTVACLCLSMESEVCRSKFTSLTPASRGVWGPHAPYKESLEIGFMSKITLLNLAVVQISIRSKDRGLGGSTTSCVAWGSNAA